MAAIVCICERDKKRTTTKRTASPPRQASGPSVYFVCLPHCTCTDCRERAKTQEPACRLPSKFEYSARNMRENAQTRTVITLQLRGRCLMRCPLLVQHALHVEAAGKGCYDEAAPPQHLYSSEPRSARSTRSQRGLSSAVETCHPFGAVHSRG